jgi:hypothetical protein
VFRPVNDFDRVARADLTRGDHPQVRAGPGGLGEALDPAGPRQPALEGAARDPRAGHLEDHVRADPPALADQGGVDRHALGGEVLAENAAGQRPVKLGLPAVEVLPGVGVDRQVRTAVVAHVEDPVAGQADHAHSLGAGRRHQHRTVDRLLVDAGQGRLFPRVRARPADIDRNYLHTTTIRLHLVG